MANSPLLIVLAFWKSLAVQRWSVLHASMCFGAKACQAAERVLPAKERLARIVNMLMGMLQRFSERAEFLREDERNLRS